MSRNRFSFLPSWKSSDSIDQNLRKISRDDYLTIVSLFGSLSGLVQGFLTTLSGMMLVDSQFLQEMYRQNDSQFSDRFIMLFFAGEIMGSLMSFPFSDSFGRKTTLIYTSIFCVVAIVWNVFTNSGGDFLTSRFIIGWAMGILLSTSPVYTSEIALTAHRGFTIGMLALTTITGSLIAAPLFYLLKNYGIGWRVCLTIPVVILIIKAGVLTLLPESPRWLLALHTPAECLDSMRQLRRTNDVSKEFNDIYLALSSDARLGESWADILSSKTIRYRLFVCCVIQLSQQMMGINIITTFGSDFLRLMDVHSVFLGLSLAYVAAFLGTLLGLSHIDVWGRRFVFLFGCCTMGVCWVGAATCVSIGGLDEGKSEIYFNSFLMRFLFGAFLCLFSFAFSFSLGLVSWILPAEIFPFRARGKVSSLTTACHAASALLSALLLRIWSHSRFDSAAGMVAFAAFSFAMALFGFLAMPETKGLMLEDMEALFSFENFPGNPPDSGSNCFCFPDMKSRIVGFHVLPDEKRIASTKTKEKCLLSDSKKASELLFEPSTLHRYSTGMREMKLEYFFGENEDEPLVSAGILPFLGPNGSREMTYFNGIHTNNSNNSSNNNNSSHGSHNSNSNNNINNNSSHSHNTHTTTSLNQSSASAQNQNHNYGQQIDSNSSSSSNQNSHTSNSSTLNHQSHPTVNPRTGTSTNTSTPSSNNPNTHTNAHNSTSSGLSGGTGTYSSNLYGSLSAPPSSSTPSSTTLPST